MERIGTQVHLPLSTAIQISLQGIRIRLGRALVTLSGVVLGIAFFMSVLTGGLIKHATEQEQVLRQTVKLLITSVKSEVGSAQGKTLAVVVIGKDSPVERALVQEIAKDKPALIRGYGLQLPGVTPVGSLADIGKDASLLLVLGDGKSCPASYADLTSGMVQKVMLDGVADRAYADALPSDVRRELLFSEKRQEEQQAEAASKQQENARTVWILIVSLLVTVIGISNALLMSVTERFKEIGTMKCLGALSSFIRQLFLIESALIGFVGSVLGILLGALFPLLAYAFTFSFSLVFGSLDYGQLALSSLASLVVGTLLSIVAAIYPAQFASRMLPAMALRSNV